MRTKATQECVGLFFYMYMSYQKGREKKICIVDNYNYQL